MSKRKGRLLTVFPRYAPRLSHKNISRAYPAARRGEMIPDVAIARPKIRGRGRTAGRNGGGKLLKKFFPRSPLSKLKNREIGHADALKKSKSVHRNGVRVHHFKSFKLRSFFEANRRGLGSDQKLFRPLQKQGVNTSVSAEHGYEHVF